MALPSLERLKIEKLKPGEKIKYHLLDYTRIATIVSNLNNKARFEGKITKRERIFIMRRSKSPGNFFYVINQLSNEKGVY